MINDLWFKQWNGHAPTTKEKVKFRSQAPTRRPWKIIWVTSEFEG
jgi:hypothetical protein